MLDSLQTADEMVNAALGVLEKRDDSLLSALDRLPAPLYVTDAEGFVTYFNSSCIGFAGRTPAVGKDRWCVTWKLYTDEGEFLPHDACPMAVAIRSRRPVRGVTAFAERPNGERVAFAPFPTPLLGEDGELRGAINLLVDITDVRQIAELCVQASRCRRLAAAAADRRTAETLRLMADEYEAKAAALPSGG